MYILHIETSTKTCSVAVSKASTFIEGIDIVEGMNHATTLAPAIRQLLDIVNLVPGELAGISVSSGPGSFTGLRVGVSTAKAMAYTLGVPLLAVPSLFSLAHACLLQHPEAELVMPMLDARRNEVYTSLYDRKLNELISASSLVLEGDKLEQYLPNGKVCVCCGDGSMKIDLSEISPDLRVDSTIQCRAEHLIVPAYQMFIEKRHIDPVYFVPFYLKPPNITRPKAGG